MDRLADLRAAISRLAQPADAQTTYLVELGTWPSTDELALEFDDALASVRGNLPEAAAKAVAQLNEHLAAMGRGLWSIDKLRSAPEWQTARQLAANCLRALG